MKKLEDVINGTKFQKKKKVLVGSYTKVSFNEVYSFRFSILFISNLVFIKNVSCIIHIHSLPWVIKVRVCIVQCFWLSPLTPPPMLIEKPSLTAAIINQSWKWHCHFWQKRWHTKSRYLKQNTENKFKDNKFTVCNVHLVTSSMQIK